MGPFTLAVLAAQLDVILSRSEFKHVRNFGNIAPTKSPVGYTRDFEVADQNEKKCIDLRDKTRRCKRALRRVWLRPPYPHLTPSSLFIFLAGDAKT